jgi:hypothetical protein
MILDERFQETDLKVGRASESVRSLPWAGPRAGWMVGRLSYNLTDQAIDLAA